MGRIEEVRARRLPNGDREVTGFHFRSGALLERLAVVTHLPRRMSDVIIARWDPIDVQRPDAPVLMCPGT